MENISDLSDLCRLCLDTSSVLISFETKIYFTPRSIPELIRFCLDINCNIKDGGILPKNVCQSCLEKLQSAYELKNKGKESDKYLRELLNQTEDVDDEDETQLTPYDPAPPHYHDQEDEGSLLQLVDDYNDGHSSSDGSNKFKRGQKHGHHVCPHCRKTFKYSKPFKRHLKEHKAKQSNGMSSYRNVSVIEKSLLQVEDDDEDEDDSDSSFQYQKGERLGHHVCGFCHKEFKYSKAYKRHVKEHNNGKITTGGYKRRNKPKYKKIATAEPVAATTSEQAPYDSRSPYGSPPPFESSVRDSSPDFGTLVTSSFLNGSNDEVTIEPVRKRLRLNKEKSASREHSPLVEVTKPGPLSRPGRGRPRKEPIVEKLDYDDNSIPQPTTSSRGRGRPRKNPLPDEADEVISPLADFSEVDVSTVLKSKSNILFDDSISQSAASTNRSRSSSVELIQEFDIFGSVLPDDGNLNNRSKTGFGSGNTFGCNVSGCDKKFHLKANLKKHLREVHGKQ